MDEQQAVPAPGTPAPDDGSCIRRGTRWTIRHMTDLALRVHPGLERASVQRPYHNTLHFRVGNKRVWRFWHTDIVVQHVDDSVVLQNGGHQSCTTASRINDILGSLSGYHGTRVWSERRIWKLRHANQVYGFAAHTRLYVDGRVEGALDLDKERRRHARVNARIKKFVDVVRKRLLREEWPLPSAGDCFYCQMRTPDGRSLGDVSGSEHLKSHMEQRYVHGSLLVNAIGDRGYDDPMTQYALRHAMKDVPFVLECLTKYLRKRVLAPADRMEQTTQPEG